MYNTRITTMVVESPRSAWPAAVLTGDVARLLLDMRKSSTTEPPVVRRCDPLGGGKRRRGDLDTYLDDMELLDASRLPGCDKRTLDRRESQTGSGTRQGRVVAVLSRFTE